MSALLEKPNTKTTTQTRRRVHRSQQPLPEIRIRARVRERTAPSVNVLGVIVSKIVLFGVFCGFSYGASSLGGHVMAEGARQQRLSARAHATEARKAQVVLQERVDRLTGEVNQWALARGFSHGQVAGSEPLVEVRVAAR